MSEIEFFTNDELVDELMKRESFVGMILMAEDSREVESEDFADFKMFGRGFAPEEAHALLSSVVDQMGDDEEE